MVSEIASWVFENQLKLDEDTIREIRDELKDIKLRDGECIVCNNKKIAEGCFEKVLNILERNNESKVLGDFKKFCGLAVLA